MSSPLLLRSCLGVVGLLLLSSNSLIAHPVPTENHDRTLAVFVSAEALIVDVRLEVDSLRAQRDLSEYGFKVPAGEDWQSVYRREMANVLREGLVVGLDNKALPLELIQQSHQRTDHLRCDYRFRALWSLSTKGESHTLRLYESNFPESSQNRIVWSLTSSGQVSIADEVISGGQDDLSDRAKRTLSATLRLDVHFAPGTVRMGLPPDIEPYLRGARGRERQLAGVHKPTTSQPREGSKPPPQENPPSTPHAYDLDRLLDSSYGFLGLMVLAMLFGAAHALTPGHGKAMVAAYLVGERGTIWHAIFLGIVTTLTHTAAVLIVAALLPWFFPNAAPKSVQGVLELIAGLLIAGLGLWLLMQRLAGRADHVHLTTDESSPRWWNLLVLGVSGGMVPCWDAIAMLGLAIGTQRMWLGLPLLLAFSAGLAGVLVVVGIVVVRSRDVVEKRLGSEQVGRWMKVLPILSAVLVTALGLWMCFGGLH
jgi:ABC-type nickel/cobalt efflux system permease component RcnA